MMLTLRQFVSCACIHLVWIPCLLGHSETNAHKDSPLGYGARCFRCSRYEPAEPNGFKSRQCDERPGSAKEMPPIKVGVHKKVILKKIGIKIKCL